MIIGEKDEYSMTESTPAKNTDHANPQVAFESGLGRSVIEVYEDKAPKQKTLEDETTIQAEGTRQ
jgi:hypothetical protein